MVAHSFLVKLRTYKLWAMAGISRVKVFDLLGHEVLGMLCLHVTTQPHIRGGKTVLNDPFSWLRWAEKGVEGLQTLLGGFLYTQWLPNLEKAPASCIYVEKGSNVFCWVGKGLCGASEASEEQCGKKHIMLLCAGLGVSKERWARA